MANAPWYRVGTASVTAGSRNVSGVDTLWLGALGSGDLFTLDGTRWAEVESVTSNTALVLKTAWGGATAANQAYAIARNFTGTASADLAAALTLLMQRYHVTLDEMGNLYTATGDVQVTDPEGVEHTVPGWVKLAAQIDAALPKAGGMMTGMLVAQPTVGAVGAGEEQATRGLEARSAGGSGDGAFMVFHRPGSFIAKFGLDTDNKWKVGGWSMGSGVAHKIWHAGEQGAGSGLDADLLDGLHASDFLQKSGGLMAGELQVGPSSSWSSGFSVPAGGQGTTPLRAAAFGVGGTVNVSYEGQFRWFVSSGHGSVYKDGYALRLRSYDVATGESPDLLSVVGRNVGVGTPSPVSIGANYRTLDVAGASTTQGGYLISSTSDGSHRAQLGTDGGVTYVGSRTNHPVAFTVNNTECLRLNVGGGVTTSGPIKPGQYTLSTLPSASTYNGYTITVSNATGGPALCLSDGANWINVRTNAAVS